MNYKIRLLLAGFTLVNIPLPGQQPVAGSRVVYKIQVGAFKRHVSLKRFKATGLNVSIVKESDGLNHYEAGIFYDLTAAENEKDKLRKMGFKDAFVVAYSGQEAVGSGQDAGGSGLNNMVDTSAFPPGVIYTVQVARFTGKLAKDKEDKLLSIAIQSGIHLYKDSSGTNIYSMGRFTSYSAGAQYKETLEGKGITDATVIEFLNGKPIK